MIGQFPTSFQQGNSPFPLFSSSSSSLALDLRCIGSYTDTYIPAFPVSPAIQVDTASNFIQSSLEALEAVGGTPIFPEISECTGEDQAEIFSGNLSEFDVEALSAQQSPVLVGESRGSPTPSSSTHTIDIKLPTDADVISQSTSAWHIVSSPKSQSTASSDNKDAALDQPNSTKHRVYACDVKGCPKQFLKRYQLK
jgi:hypothetical protein